ncbi:MAG: 6,7-dimethyl-8-ribityllumazine synthase [Candidatus Eisenbacteria sp.]|nr:6,7-dimethyl-8-ribityllumazine synthase [Candidatus Eisenbacteria bacterium]
MARVFEGLLDGRGKRFGVVVSRFNDLVSNRLLDGALDCLKRHEVADDAVDVAWVPGALEIPLVARAFAESKNYDVVICLGAVIRGATSHFERVSSEVTRGVGQLSAQTGIPVIFGILTAETLEQALERAGAKSGNRGWAAALSALEMADLMSRVRG